MTKPLCMTNYAITDDLLYANRPCHKSKGLISLNFNIEKSLAKAAYFPSLPIMPTPTSAAWIIATSFPPSPIDKVTEPVNAFIASTTYAFWVGEHRQQITEGALVETFINYYKNYPNAIAND